MISRITCSTFLFFIFVILWSRARSFSVLRAWNRFSFISLTHDRRTILIARVHLHSAVEGPSGQGPWNKISIQDNTPKTDFPWDGWSKIFLTATVADSPFCNFDCKIMSLTHRCAILIARLCLHFGSARWDPSVQGPWNRVPFKITWKSFSSR